MPQQIAWLFTLAGCRVRDVSHYIALFFILFIAWFAVVGRANVYMSLFGRLRVDVKAERLEIASKEKSLDGTPPSSPRE
jgi:hypothetical protein